MEKKAFIPALGYDFLIVWYDATYFKATK